MRHAAALMSVHRRSVAQFPINILEIDPLPVKQISASAYPINVQIAT